MIKRAKILTLCLAMKDIDTLSGHDAAGINGSAGFEGCPR